MPRKKITISDRVEYLSILNAQGELDKKLEPDIPDDFLLKLFRTMFLARKFDERLLSLQRQGRIGTFPPISGQEAAHLGAAAALQPTDWMVPAFRETAAEIWRGRLLENVIVYNNGFNEGGAIPEDSHDFPISVPVGSQVLHAVGLAWAAKYRRKDEVAMAFFGDGATSEGDFHEGLNFAAVFQAPAIFVCQNNQWAISIPLSRQTRSKTLAQKAIAYGMPGIQVDGNDILAVYAAAKEAVERADDPKRYRTDKEVEQWQKRDPLPRFQKYLVGKGLLSDENIAEIESEVMQEIQEAVDRAAEKVKTIGDPLGMFDHAYAEMPPYLKEQKEGLERELAELDKEAGHG
jgi:TPP-dependent pyruvate/acetoin dehydrogenase alpha subunit